MPDGLPELRDIIARQHRDATGVEVSADDNVLVTAGNMEGVKCSDHRHFQPSFIRTFGDVIRVAELGHTTLVPEGCIEPAQPIFD